MFRIRFVDDAVEDLERLDRSVSRKLIKKIKWLAENAETIKPIGLRGDLSGLSKLRQGDFRIIYELLNQEQLVIIHFIGHRSEVYKKR